MCVCVCVCVCVYTHTICLSKELFFLSTRGKDGSERHSVVRNRGKILQTVFWLLFSVPCFSALQPPWGTTGSQQLVSIWESGSGTEEKMLSSALFLVSEKSCKWWVVCLNIHVLCHRIQQIRISFFWSIVSLQYCVHYRYTV